MLNVESYALDQLQAGQAEELASKGWHLASITRAPKGYRWIFERNEKGLDKLRESVHDANRSLKNG